MRRRINIQTGRPMEEGIHTMDAQHEKRQDALRRLIEARDAAEDADVIAKLDCQLIRDCVVITRAEHKKLYTAIIEMGEQARRWYNADGTFTDMEPEALIEKRKAAAVDLVNYESLKARVRVIDIVFDGPPTHESGRFVEVENQVRASIKIGDWVDRGDGTWALRLAAVVE